MTSVASLMRSSTASPHLFGGGDLDQFAMRGRMQGRRPADENHLCAAAVRGLGQRVAHLAAGAVAEEADRVESLARAARGDQHHFAGQIVAAAQCAQHRIGNRRPARPCVPRPPCRRPDRRFPAR